MRNTRNVRFGSRPLFITLASLLAPAASAWASGNFASLAPGGYTRGDIYIANDALYGITSYNDPVAGLAAPEPIVGVDSGAYATLYNPFNAHYESNQLVAFGRGGSLTVELPHVVPVTGTPQIGVFTNAGLNDYLWPSGTADAVAQTFAHVEYGAERSALVEVGDSLGHWQSAGRIVFASPGNYYANVTSNSGAVAPNPAVLADFDQPFTKPLSAFNGKNFTGVIDVLDGSAGGTWITIPSAPSLTNIQYIRFSDTLWKLPDGTTAETRTSIYDSTYIKPADLYIDAVTAIPEPASLGVLCGIALFFHRRRSMTERPI